MIQPSPSIRGHCAHFLCDHCGRTGFGVVSSWDFCSARNSSPACFAEHCGCTPVWEYDGLPQMAQRLRTGPIVSGGGLRVLMTIFLKPFLGGALDLLLDRPQRRTRHTRRIVSLHGQWCRRSTGKRRSTSKPAASAHRHPRIRCSGFDRIGNAAPYAQRYRRSEHEHVHDGTNFEHRYGCSLDCRFARARP